MDDQNLIDIAANKSAVEDLKKKLDEMQSSSGFQLRFPLDPDSEKILKDYISSQIMDIVWDGYFFYSTGFVSSEEFTSAGASVIFDGGGVTLITAASSNTNAYVFRDLALLESVDFSKESRFRTRVLIGTGTSRLFEIGIGSLSLPNITNHGYGFVIDENVLYGFAQTAFASRTTAQLMTITGSSYLSLDARYSPKGRVDFFVNNKLLGSVSSNLPVGIDTSVQFFGAVISTENGTAKSINIMSFEFMQRRSQ